MRYSQLSDDELLAEYARAEEEMAQAMDVASGPDSNPRQRAMARRKYRVARTRKGRIFRALLKRLAITTD